MNSHDLRLLVGLGNPGSKYKYSRHNIGFMVLKKLANKESVYFRQSKKLFGETAEIGIGEDLQRLLLPNTFMNESGRSIRATMEWFGIASNQILVLVDDMDLPLGRLRLRSKGSSGGHNGLKSIITHLGTDNFCRLRIGIGRPSLEIEGSDSKAISHVLGNFTSEENPILKEIIDEVITNLDLIKRLGLERAINHINSYRKDI
tara:strand:+ start:10249 stop:10857 length:609 start_codon:yes stop_codon:yes gene_type:complete